MPKAPVDSRKRDGGSASRRSTAASAATDARTAPSRMPPSQTCSGTPSRLCTSARRTTPAGRIRARARSTPKRREIARAGRVCDEAERLRELGLAEPRADEPARGARAAADGERGLDMRRRDSGEGGSRLRARVAALVVAEADAVDARR